MTDRLWEFLPIDVKFVSKGRLGSPPETFNSSEAWGKCSSRLVVCGLTEPVCSPTPGLEPPSVDRSAAFIYTGPVLLFTDHHLYWSSSSITRVQGSTWIRHYRKCWASSYIYINIHVPCLYFTICDILNIILLLWFHCGQFSPFGVLVLHEWNKNTSPLKCYCG